MSHHSRIKVIQGHNIYQNTDKLYQPLRQTLLHDTTIKSTQLLQASRISHLSHIAKPRQLVQNYQIGEKTYIIQNAKLRPTHKTWKLPRDCHYQIVNVQQKKYEPITEQQMRQIMGKTNYKEEVVVYTYESERQSQICNQDINLPMPNIQQTNTNNYRPSSTIYTRPASAPKDQLMDKLQQTMKIKQVTNSENQSAGNNSYKARKLTFDQAPIELNEPLKRMNLNKSKKQESKGKYNMFSLLDEPLNNILSGKMCSCPANELIAEKQHQISWYSSMKQIDNQ